MRDALVAVWPESPEAIRAGILAMVRATSLGALPLGGIGSGEKE